MSKTIAELIDKIEASLDQYIPSSTSLQHSVIDAMRYSVLSPGKRIRAMLLLEFNRICGGNIDDAIPFACAIEMIHASSLIHDDLPCMDNDDMRRGKPSCHIAFDEAIALLAGDALIVTAFNIMLNANDVEIERIVKASQCLSDAVGAHGMIGGQTIDLMNEHHSNMDEQKITLINELKTIKLISAACEIGCIVAGANNKQIATAKAYAYQIGMAFQIVDDVLDVIGDPAILGKPIGSDDKKGKYTYVDLYGIDKSMNIANTLIKQAKDTLFANNMESGYLLSLADYIVGRQR